MHIKAIHIKDYKNLKNLTLSFDREWEYYWYPENGKVGEHVIFQEPNKFLPPYEKLKGKSGIEGSQEAAEEWYVRKRQYPVPEKFYGENIENIIGIVGENGTGKSSIFNKNKNIIVLNSKLRKSNINLRNFIVIPEIYHTKAHYDFVEKNDKDDILSYSERYKFGIRRIHETKIFLILLLIQVDAHLSKLLDATLPIEFKDFVFESISINLNLFDYLENELLTKKVDKIIKRYQKEGKISNEGWQTINKLNIESLLKTDEFHIYYELIRNVIYELILVGDIFDNFIIGCKYHLSSGQYHYVDILYETLAIIQSSLFIYDEIDNSFNPKLQIKFVKLISDLISECKKTKSQIFFTSHSPIMLSDLHQSSVIQLRKLKKDDEGFGIDGVKRKAGEIRASNPAEPTFGANIFQLYKDAFFLDSMVGEFAQTKIDQILLSIYELNNGTEKFNEEKEKTNKIEPLKSILGKDPNLKTLKEEIPSRCSDDNEYAKLIRERVEIIGDRHVRQVLINEIDDNNAKIEYYKKEIERLQTLATQDA